MNEGLTHLIIKYIYSHIMYINLQIRYLTFLLGLRLRPRRAFSDCSDWLRLTELSIETRAQALAEGLAPLQNTQACTSTSFPLLFFLDVKGQSP